MNIAHISTATTWRGGEQQIAYLYKELQSHGINQVIMCVEGSELEAYAAKHRWNCATAYKGGGFSYLFAKQIAFVCKQQHIDLLHIHDSHAHNNALLAQYLFGVKLPMVLSRRVVFKVGGNPFSKWKYNHPSIKSILCVSEAVREVMSNVVNDATRLSVIYEAVDVSKISAPDGRLRREFNIASDAKLIGNVAALTPEKDLVTFLKTVSRLKGKANAKYVIVGEGNERTNIEATIKQMGLGSDVILTGFRNDAKTLLAEFDILMMTSVQEGLGTTILDAFLCGVPVVSTAAGGIPEIVRHEETGLLVKLKDDEGLAENVLKLLGDEDLKNKIIAGGLRKVQEHSTVIMAEKTLAVYKDILDRL